MKRIQDIRPVRKERQAEPERVFENPEIVEPEVPEAPKAKAPRGHREKSSSLLKQIFFSVFILIILSAFWLFSLQKTKVILSKEFSGVGGNFSALTENISNKDLPKLGDQIKELNGKASNALLVLQSTGQDVYCFSLIYPKGKASKSTILIDGVRSAHMLTYSYQLLIPGEMQSSSSSKSSNYLDKINQYIGGLKEYNSKLYPKIKFAGFLTNFAESILTSNNYDAFSKDERQQLEGLSKLSEVSATFFSYLASLPAELSDSFAFSVPGQRPSGSATGGEKSYLILFLNNAELRPGGGFIGSFARIDFKDGNVSALDFEKNIYTLDKEFLAKGNIIVPPDEVKVLAANWSMRDSNMSADFPTSAQKVAWFYDQEAGKKVDGVFALDTTFFRNLLKIVGPISMPEYGMQITDQNFLRDVQYQVEIGYFKDKENWSENQPKKILADMMPKFITLLTQKGNKQKEISAAVVKAVKEKHLLFYFNNQKLEDLVDGAGASGKIANGNGDYLYICDANIGGYKSSLNIEQTVNQNIEIKSSGDVEEKISITRKHVGSYEWPDGINNNFSKVFVPLTSKVKSVNFVSGDNNPRSDITKATSEKYSNSVEFGKSVVSFWQNTKPGETSQTDISLLREKAVKLVGDSFDYQVKIQKQPGVEKYKLNLYIVYPEGWKPQNVEGYDEISRQILLKETILSDSVFHLRFIRAQSG